MFLDDELYEWVKLRDIEKPGDAVILLKECHGICSDTIIKKIGTADTIQHVELKLMFTRAFRLWDMFVERLERENHAMASLLRKYSYKDNVLSDPNLKKYVE